MTEPSDHLADADRQFEAALRRLDPVAPSHNPFPTNHAPGIIPFPERRRRRWPRAALAAAAVIAFAATVVYQQFPSAAPSVAALDTADGEITFDVEPIQEIGYLVDARPAPIIEVPGGTPLRPVRLRTVNTTLYRDNTTGSTITVGEPNDQILLLPVSFY